MENRPPVFTGRAGSSRSPSPTTSTVPRGNGNGQRSPPSCFPQNGTFLSSTFTIRSTQALTSPRSHCYSVLPVDRNDHIYWRAGNGIVRRNGWIDKTFHQTVNTIRNGVLCYILIRCLYITIIGQCDNKATPLGEGPSNGHLIETHGSPVWSDTDFTQKGRPMVPLPSGWYLCFSWQSGRNPLPQCWVIKS